MNTLVLLRRALEIIRTDGFQNKTADFSHKLRKETTRLDAAC